jgi:hypothetical protein
MQLLVLITHHLNDLVADTLDKLNNTASKRHEVLVLFDRSKYSAHETVERWRNIQIQPTDLIDTSYDHGGHAMYINHFRTRKEDIRKYKHIWIFENDVYYPASLTEFADLHDAFHHDLLVPEYGLRPGWWCWTKTLKGFRNVQNVGVLAVAMRMSPRLLTELIDTIDIHIFGYLEAILPHICLENGFSIQQFMPQTCGIVTPTPDPLLELIVMDIRDGTRKYLREKIYHPVKTIRR